MTEQSTAVAAPVWDLADRMRKALRESELGVQEIADYLGVSRNTVSTWINGRIRPDTRTQRLWALRCGVPYEWLVGDEGPKPGLPRLDSNQQPAGSGKLVPFARRYRNIPKGVLSPENARRGA